MKMKERQAAISLLLQGFKRSYRRTTKATIRFFFFKPAACIFLNIITESFNSGYRSATRHFLIVRAPTAKNVILLHGTLVLILS